MVILDVISNEFNKGQRTASKKLIKAVISGGSSRDELSKVYRVSSNKISDMRRFIKELENGESFAFRGVSGWLSTSDVKVRVEESNPLSDAVVISAANSPSATRHPIGVLLCGCCGLVVVMNFHDQEIAWRLTQSADITEPQ